MRRLVYFAIAISQVETSKAYIQIMAILFCNIFMIIYIGQLMPMRSPLQNRILLFNELMVQFISIHVMLFTDWVTSEDDKFFYGWHICFWISVMILYNMQFVIRYTVRVIYLVIKKYFNVFESYIDLI